MTAPGAGTGGQNMDLALVLADEGPKGRADPAYDAHGLPIGEWAMAVWEQWESEKTMQLTINRARLKFAKVKNKWAVSYGPGVAFILTGERLKWEVMNATMVRTDLGVVLNMKLDPPAVVIQECHLAVQRWRWRKVETVFPQLAASGSGRGPLMEPFMEITAGQEHRC